MRPQGAAFAASAKNRESVMSLGSIAHLQYYFARTGMLDGKGGQMAKDTRKGTMNLAVATVDPADDTISGNLSHIGNDFVSSPFEEDFPGEWETSTMLPPTVSTYSHRTPYLPPPPDAATLRKDLQDGLTGVAQAITEVRRNKIDNPGRSNGDSVLKENEYLENVSSDDVPRVPSPARSWHELEGMHILDVVTLAIRSAKMYYTMHEHPQRLAIIKSERQVREELLVVLDTLKRTASRNWAGGLKEEELQIISNWVASVHDFLAKEQVIEEREAKDRESWKWLEGNWDSEDRNRERLFINTFIEGDDLPEWTPPADADKLPTPFLQALSSGLSLVKMHTRILKMSRRQFGEIKTFHTDTAKPYRAAENLRYWIKAAEIRWETKLRVDVIGVVYNKGDDVWKDFDAAILEWSRAVREEITKEWKQGSVRVSRVTSDG